MAFLTFYLTMISIYLKLKEVNLVRIKWGIKFEQEQNKVGAAHDAVVGVQ